MATRTINLTLDSSCDCGPHAKPVCPYCHQENDDPNHLDRMHPITAPQWWLRAQQDYIDRIVAAHEAVGDVYRGPHTVPGLR